MTTATPEDPMQALVRLRQRLEEVLAPLGMQLHAFSVQPMDGGPHVAQAVLVFETPLEAEVPSTSAEEDAIFKEMVRDFNRQNDDEKAAEAAEKLKKMEEQLRKPGGGILDA